MMRPGPTAFNLLDQSFNPFDFLPRNFTISTNNSSCKFNVDVIKRYSPVITESLNKDPSKLEYHIDTDDEKNVMEKIERLFTGNGVIFNNDEILFVQKISELLNLVCLPNFLKPYHLQRRESNLWSINNTKNTFRNDNSGKEVKLSNISCIEFINQTCKKPFKIIINEKQYFCNIIGVRSSKKISELIEKNPDLDEFTYDTDDDSGYFQIICDLFNFDWITITNNNMESLKHFAEDLGIECVIEKIDEFIEHYEATTQTLTHKESVIEEIDEMFDLLFNRENRTLDSVYISIITSKWLKKKDSVIELAAFIHQVIQNDFRYHQFMLDLILRLDKEAESKYIKFLIPTIINLLLDNLSTDMLNPAFTYKLCKHGLISKNEIALKVHEIFLKSMEDEQKSYQSFSRSSNNNESWKDKNPFLPIMWFYPEINEIYGDNINSLENKFASKNNNNRYAQNNNNSLPETYICHFIKDNSNNNFQELRKKREMGEPDDALTKALINDDVDTFQSIISQMNLSLDQGIKATIPFNLYESFIVNGETTYINYAASRGSVRCFKFLLLNGCIIDGYTLSYAVFGENSEIIRLVDQYYSENNIVFQLSNSYHGWGATKQQIVLNPIIPAIKKNHNDLFDWILQEKYINQDKSGNCLLDLLIIASKNGNAHALGQFIDNGLDLNE